MRHLASLVGSHNAHNMVVMAAGGRQPMTISSSGVSGGSSVVGSAATEMTLRRSTNLTSVKLALYEKWSRRMQRFASRIQTVDGVKKGPLTRHRQARSRVKRYFAQMLEAYEALNLPLDETNQSIQNFLAAIAPLDRAIYVMRTGLGKGISFSESQTARMLKVSRLSVQARFGELCQQLRKPFEDWTSSEAQQLIIDVRALTPELIRHLQQHHAKLDDLTWDVYEQLIAEFFASWGYAVSLVGRSASTSADIIAIRPPDSSGIAVKCFIEVKKWKHKVGITTINEVLGAILSERVAQGFHVGIIVSSSGFQEIRKIGKDSLAYLGLELRDGEDVRQWLKTYSPSPTGLWLPADREHPRRDA